MSGPVNIVFLLLLSVLCAAGEKGYVRFINATDVGKGLMNFSVDGKSLYEKGYGSGQKTGGLGFPEGQLIFVASKNDCEPASLKISVVAGKTTSYIVYAIRSDSRRKNAPPWKLQIRSLPQSSPEKGFELSVLSLTSIPELTLDLSLGGVRKGSVSALKQQVNSIPLKGVAGENVEVSIKGRPFKVLGFDEAGRTFLILYQTSDGRLKATDFFDADIGSYVEETDD